MKGGWGLEGLDHLDAAGKSKIKKFLQQPCKPPTTKPADILKPNPARPISKYKEPKRKQLELNENSWDFAAATNQRASTTRRRCLSELVALFYAAGAPSCAAVFVWPLGQHLNGHSSAVALHKRSTACTSQRDSQRDPDGFALRSWSSC